MQTLMDRLDALIKVTRERANEGRSINEFDKLYHALRNMSSDQEAVEMVRKWNELEKELKLNNWDEHFLKAVAGEEKNPDNLFYTDAQAYTQLHQEKLTQNKLVKAIIEMQKEKEKAELEKEIQKAELENVKIEARTCK